MTRGDGTALLSVCLFDLHRNHGFDLIVCRLPVRRSLIRLLREAATGKGPSTSYLPPGHSGSTAFLCCRLSLYYWFLGRHYSFFSFPPLHFTPPFGLLHGDHHQRASASQFIPTATFFTPRSARFRATRLVPYLIPSATAMEKKKTAGNNSRQTAKRRHTARGNRALWVLWRCILTTDFLFSSLFFFLSSSVSNFSSLTLFTRRYLGEAPSRLPPVGVTQAVRVKHSSDRIGICRHRTMGMSDDATRMYS